MPRIEIIVPDSPPQPFSLPMTEGFSAVIGREEDCDICVPIASVSSRHAALDRCPGGIVLRDIGSTNGLSVDGVRVEKTLLSPTVQVMLGEACLSYTESPEERALFDSEKSGESEPVSEVSVIAPAPRAARHPAEPSPRASYSPVVQVEVQKPSYVPMVLYAIVVFALAIVAGMTYQHYKKTGNLLPLIWMGREPLPVQPAVQEGDAAPAPSSADSAE